ncbi:hypothetical protein MUG91_G42n290 [Manis pentadactyla]|nr:hypothetical protein MUG91_G42n290 [Manis pentadactyla]
MKLCVCKSQPGDEGDEEETLQGASNPVFNLTLVMRYIQGFFTARNPQGCPPQASVTALASCQPPQTPGRQAPAGGGTGGVVLATWKPRWKNLGMRHVIVLLKDEQTFKYFKQEILLE